MFSEQFVQDLFCRPERIQRVLAEMRRGDWQFVPPPNDGEFANCDAVNQEISIAGGRIDTLATFNRRTRLVVVEVKAGSVGLEALNQLKWYLDNLPLGALGLQNVEAEQVVGVLLAEGFVGIPCTPTNVGLVEFKFNGTRWPFRVVPPRETMEQGVDDDPAPSAAKTSKLVTFRQHADWIVDRGLREAFHRIAHCFTEPGDERSDWVWPNVKGDHVAVHYKGEYLIHLWARRNYFYAGYQLNGNSQWVKFNAANRDQELAAAERDCQRLLSVVDARFAEAIPTGFSWRTAT